MIINKSETFSYPWQHNSKKNLCASGISAQHGASPKKIYISSYINSASCDHARPSRENSSEERRILTINEYMRGEISHGENCC
jgi:hypothetical protein